MKAFFYQMTRELKGGLSGCISVVGGVREVFRAFARRHPDWKMFVLGCLLFPPFSSHRHRAGFYGITDEAFR